MCPFRRGCGQAPLDYAQTNKHLKGDTSGMISDYARAAHLRPTMWRGASKHQNHAQPQRQRWRTTSEGNPITMTQAATHGRKRTPELRQRAADCVEPDSMDFFPVSETPGYGTGNA